MISKSKTRTPFDCEFKLSKKWKIDLISCSGQKSVNKLKLRKKLNESLNALRWLEFSEANFFYKKTKPLVCVFIWIFKGHYNNANFTDYNN